MPGEAHKHEPVVATPEELAALEQLRVYPFLKPLPDNVLKKLQPNLVERTYAPGDVLLRAGEYSDAAFYLKDGVIEIRFASAAQAPVPRAAGSQKAAPTAHRKSAVSADGTIIVADMPVDVSLNKR